MSVDVGAAGEFADRTVRVVRAGGREIGVVRWDGRFYALSNVCVHQNGPVCSGILSARLTAGAPGGMQLDEATPVIACPWHGWESRCAHGRRDLGCRVPAAHVLG